MTQPASNAVAILRLGIVCILTACTSSTVGIPNPAPSGEPSDTGHYAGTYYPLYNSGVKQWIEPTSSMPFDEVSDIFAAFAHVYERGNGAVLDFEQGQSAEPKRLKRLEKVARAKNPHVKILITLGWGKTHDWTHVAKDYANRAGLFVPSVVAFLRKNDLDGFDIDDESIGVEDSTGVISQAAFDAVVADLRASLNRAATEDGRAYALVITPAGDNPAKGGIEGTQIDAANAHDFDWVNAQTYWDQAWSLRLIAKLNQLHYPSSSIAVGINTEDCNPQFPAFDGLHGLFNWTMSADSACDDFKYTHQIAKDVGLVQADRPARVELPSALPWLR
jgi:hypothetical protein